MAIDQVDRTVVTRTPTSPRGRVAPGDREMVRRDSRRITRSGPGRPELGRRVIVLVFGLIQIVIGARIVLLLIDAREVHPLVAGILDTSQLFVASFEGILRTDSLNAAGPVLDLAAITAVLGWSAIELIVLWAVNLFRREPA